MPETDAVKVDLSADVSSAERGFARAYLEAAVTAAWMRRCGPSGTPGEWMIPGEFIEIGEVGCVSIEAYPKYASLRPDGQVSGWSAHLDDKSHHAWEWRFGAGWDDFTQAEIDQLEELGGCFDNRSVDFITLGSHDHSPPITDEIVEAFLIVRATDA